MNTINRNKPNLNEQISWNRENTLSKYESQIQYAYLQFIQFFDSLTSNNTNQVW